MRYKPFLNDKQIKFLLDNRLLSNVELAKQLETTPQTIANYKSRARKRGVNIPFTKNTARGSVGQKMKEMEIAGTKTEI